MTLETTHRLSPLLSPRSIAVIGGLTRPESTGFQVMRNLEAIRYSGEIFGVNPSGTSGFERPVFRTAAELPTGVDLAVVALAQDKVLPVLNELADAGVSHSIVFAAGFAESDAQGTEQQRQLVGTAKDRGLVVCGPNCSGYIAFHRSINTKFGNLLEHGIPAPGSAALVTQSGGMGGTIYTLAKSAGVGFSYVINSGNEAVVDLVDYVEYLVDHDDQTRTICLYAETLHQGERLLEVAERARDVGKRVLAILGGRTAAGQRAAFSHTGALAADGAVASSLLEEAGIVLLRNQEEVACALQFLNAEREPPRRPRVVIVTSSGANGVVTSDLAQEAGLDVPSVPDRAVSGLRKLLPGYASGRNPIDMTGTVFGDNPNVVKEVIELLDREEEDAVLLLTAAQHPAAYERVAETLAPVLANTKNFPMVTWLAPSQAIEKSFRNSNVPFFVSPLLALRVLGALTATGTTTLPSREEHEEAHEPHPDGSPGQQTTTVLTEDVIKTLLRQDGIRVPEGALVTTFEEAMTVADRVGYPVAVKVCSPQIAHRMRYGLLALGVSDQTQLHDEWERLQGEVRSKFPHAFVKGLLVEEMVPGGHELFVGIKGRSEFGSILALGLGGVAVESATHVQFARLPLDQLRVSSLVSRVRLDQVLTPAALAALEGMLLATSRLWDGRRSIVELDLNPVICLPDGLVVADGLALEEVVA